MSENKPGGKILEKLEKSVLGYTSPYRSASKKEAHAYPILKDLSEKRAEP